MIISAQWIRELLPAVSWNPTDVAQQLTFAGLEVEHITDQAARLQGFVVGFVTDKQPHPKADKLSVCTVDVGRDTAATIVCGAPNVAAGQFVPVALPGCRLPDADFTIAERPLRGVTSQGMICSQAELGLGDDADGIWILSGDLVAGSSLADALAQTDILLDVAITPNRADALSHLGVAREIALLTDYATPHTVDVMPQAYEADPTVANVKVAIEAPELCHRFLALPIDGLTIQPSPEWMQRRLRACGLRPRNVIVDVTNYVMLELGQPLHAYDARTVAQRTFVVRQAGAVAPFTTLDGTVRTLAADMLMICDAHQPLGVAGVMGGKNSEVAPDTVDVILESAWFLPSSIRRTAKVLDIQSDASYRFERGVDPNIAKTAVLRAAELLVTIAGGRRGALTDVVACEYQAPMFAVRFDRTRRILGTHVENQTIVRICKAMHCNVLEETPESIVVQPPSWRVDISSEIDIIEEIMRVVGLDAIPAPSHTSVPTQGASLPAALRVNKVSSKLMQGLVSQGYYDCCTTSQTSPHMAQLSSDALVEVANPLGVDGSAMRTSLLPGLVKAAAWNLRHGATEVRLAETGRVFLPDATSALGVVEERRIAFVACGSTATQWQSASRVVDFYDVAGTLESICDHAGLSRPTVAVDDVASALWGSNVGTVVVDSKVVGRIGQIHPGVASEFGIDLPIYGVELAADLLTPVVTRYQAPSAYPTVERDLAIVLPSQIAAGAVLQAVENTRPDILSAIHIFDVFTDERYVGAGKKSLGLRLTFLRSDRTLVDQEVDAAVSHILSVVERSCGATLRGSIS